jgi:uncharacterized protein (TIGR02284 family)
MPWNRDKLDELLKNELASVETYQQALDKIREDTGLGEAQELVRIYEDHKDSASKLETQIRQLGGVPPTDSGAWGTWSKIVMGSAKLLGDKAALSALREGEENGAQDYQEALEDMEVPTDVQSLIRGSLLPKQQAHIQTLNRLIEAI